MAGSKRAPGCPSARGREAPAAYSEPAGEATRIYAPKVMHLDFVVKAKRPNPGFDAPCGDLKV
jgi:hypothetical protein